MSIFALDTESMNEYIWFGYWGHEWVYLACITLDTTILQQASSLPFKVEGTFLLDILPVILGYEHPSSLITTQTLTSDLKSSGHTHLQLFIALEPPLGVLPPIKDQVRNKSVFLACIALDTKYIAV